MPIPIPLNDLVRWAPADFAGLDRGRILVVFDATNHFHSERTMTELREVACAIGIETAIDGVETIPLIGGTVKDLGRRGVLVQRALFRWGLPAVEAGLGGKVPLLSSGCPPVGDGRKVILIVVGIEGEGDSDLSLIAEALDVLRFGLCLGKGGEQHAGEDGNDRNDYEQFNEGEPTQCPRISIQDSFHG